MAVDDYKGMIVAEGVFLYDGTTPMTLHIVAHNYDYFYEMAKEGDWLEPGETPKPLGENGLLYRIEPSQSVLFQTVADAKEWAARQPWAPITWSDIPASAA